MGLLDQALPSSHPLRSFIFLHQRFFGIIEVLDHPLTAAINLLRPISLLFAFARHVRWVHSPCAMLATFEFISHCELEKPLKSSKHPYHHTKLPIS